MEWILGATLLCVVGLVVVFPLAWKQEAATQRVLDEAKNRIKTLEQHTVQLNIQLKDELERHRVELEAVRQTLKQAEPSLPIPSAQKLPSSPPIEGQENVGRQA